MTWEQTGPHNDKFIPVEEFGIGTWRDGPVGSDAPVNAIVVHFTMEAVLLGMGLLESIQEGNTIKFGIRLKSRARVEYMVGLLNNYADEVWPR
jgi:hypothetical protein